MRLHPICRLLSFGFVTSPLAVRAQTAAQTTARVQIQAQYDRMARAIAAKDVAGVTRLFSPLDTAAEDQPPWWRAAFAKTRRARLVITVDTVAVRGDTAGVAYTEHDTITTGTVEAPRITAVTLHEVAWWVRGPTGWLHQAYVSAALPVRVRDGVPLPPTRADSAKLAVGLAETRRRSWPPAPAAERTARHADSTMTEAALWPVIRALADDSMLGRRPGTRGDTLTVRYLEAQFRASGLTPGGTYGYAQPVQLTRMGATGTMTLHTGGRVERLLDRDLLIRGTRSGRTAVRGARVVFAGYGLVAPEFGWDDYKDVDVRGAVVVLLPGTPAALAARTFGAPGSTNYHGLGTRRLRTAFARGAAAVIFGRAASYVNGPHNLRWWWQDRYLLAADDPDPSPPITALVTDSALARLARAGGTTLAAWQTAAARADFRPSRVPMTLDAVVDVRAESITSHNLVGIVRGRDSALGSECVVFSTHWDGYGVGPAYARADGTLDSVYNAAGDNALGLAELLAQARAASARRPAPRRTLVFVASTAEEGGLMGAFAYVAHPVCPMTRTVLAIGMDVGAAYGESGLVNDQGHGYTTLDSTFARVAADHGLRTVLPSGAINWYAGSDHSALALWGVPAVFGGETGTPVGLSPAIADSLDRAHPSHTPFDEIDTHWRLDGAAHEARFLLAVGLAVADQTAPPRWTVDSEFRRAAARRGHPAARP